MLPPHSDILTRRLLISPPSLSPLPLPLPREVHFWYVVPDEVKDASLLNHYMDLLSPCERRNLLSMEEGRVRKCALLARALVRTTLSRYTKCKMSPGSLKFIKNKYGKPEVDRQHNGHWALPSLNFNVSHTSCLVACGVTVDVPIGIDIEDKQRKLRNNIIAFARRYFSPYEFESLCAVPDPENQRQEFFKLWTLKEAYVKALGRGFSAAPFSDFTIRFQASEEVKNHTESEYNATGIIVELCDDSGALTSNWQFALFELNGSHYAAVCMEKDETTEGSRTDAMKLKAWKTIPFIEDEFVSGTDAVINLNGLSSNLNLESPA